MPAQRIPVKILRAKLKEFIEGNEPVIVMNHGRMVAVLLPTGLSYYPSRDIVKETCIRMQRIIGKDIWEGMR